MSLNDDHKFKDCVAVVRPLCEFHALPSTFAVWNQLPTYHALATDLDLDTMVEHNGIDHKDKYFNSIGTEVM